MAPSGHTAEVSHFARFFHLRSCLLLLLIAESPTHGYDLMERLAAFGFERDPGGLYRALRTMERDGLLNSEWKISPTGPGRRCYSVTPLGRERLCQEAQLLQQTRRILDSYLARYRALSRGAAALDTGAVRRPS
ncbi:MAG: PadR family transcriptional regulator [Candidatus Dormibacteraceae bacterium]